jgi:hypothetical protein
VATKAVAAKQAITDLGNMAPPPSRRLYWKNGPSFAVVNRTRRTCSPATRPGASPPTSPSCRRCSPVGDLLRGGGGHLSWNHEAKITKAKTIGRNRPMGKVTHHGWYKPSDEIPQPISILLGSKIPSRPRSRRSQIRPSGRRITRGSCRRSGGENSASTFQDHQYPGRTQVTVMSPRT